MASKREAFHHYENEGKTLSSNEEYEDRRTRRRNVRLNPLVYGNPPAVELTPGEKFRTEAFLTVIDQLRTSLKERITAYQEIYERFGLFAELRDTESEIESLKRNAKNLVYTYPNDLEPDLVNELMQFRHVIGFYKRNDDECPEMFQYRIIMENE